MHELTTAQLDQLRSTLCALDAELKAGLDQRSTSSAAVELDQTTVGRLSRMDAIQQQALSLASDRRASEQLLRVRAALARIEEQTYGRCIDCDEPLGIRRLAADPCSLLCVSCREDQESAARDEARRQQREGRRS
jgi:DnaK suppressor protein